jgi:gas vesicle protein
MRDGREVVYVERGGDASAKWFLWGAIAGAAVAIFYAPMSGEQTRRGLQRKLRKVRAMAEEKMDEFTEQIGDRRRKAEEWFEDAEESMEFEEEIDEEDIEIEATPARPTPRAELEQRLARARSRRRGVTESPEEQGA